MIRAALLAIALIPASHAQNAPIPRTVDGHPDFQGVWDSLWLTPIERPAGVPGDVPEADVERVRQVFLAREASRAKNQLDTEGEIAIAARVMRVGGVYRGSQVIDPPDGRIPRSVTGLAKKTDLPQSDGPESYNRVARCLSGVNTGPMLTANFDPLHRVVQTPGAVVIYSESLGDTRIIPLEEALASNRPRTMTGSSLAHWEHDTLVVEISRFDGSRPIGFGPFSIPLGDQAVVVERFRLFGPDELIIRYTVTDPENYTRPWTGEMAWTRSPERLYETGCHEGNYSIANMLRGARFAEERAAEKGR